MKVRVRFPPSALMLTFALGLACARGETSVPVVVAGGDSERGRDLIETYGCGGCHVIPGVRGADSWIAPPLTDWAARQYIAGALRNEPENLVRWIQDPQAVEPGTAMPTMAITEAQARDIAAYLYTIGDTRPAGPPRLLSTDVLRGLGHWASPKKHVGSREDAR